MTFDTEPHQTKDPAISSRSALEVTLYAIHSHLRQYAAGDDVAPYPWPEEAEALEDQDIEVLWAWLIEAERASAAARLLRDRIEAVMLVDIKRNGAVKLGDLLYRPTPKTGKRWAFDGASRRLLEYLLEPLRTGRAATKASNKVLLAAIETIDEAIRIDAGNVRLMYLDSVAARRAVGAAEGDLTKDEILASQYAVRDTFIARDRDTADGYSLAKVPAKRQPKWALRMSHGERNPI